MIWYTEPKDKSPEEYPAMPTELSNKEIELIRKRINNGKTIDDVLSESTFSCKAISTIYGFNIFGNTQYIQGAYFRMLQADDIIKNIAPNNLDLVDKYVIIRFLLRDLQQRKIHIIGIKTFDETDTQKIYQKLEENLRKR